MSELIRIYIIIYINAYIDFFKTLQYESVDKLSAISIISLDPSSKPSDWHMVAIIDWNGCMMQ